MNLAPIVLFVYNRPEHTKKTLEALTKNDLANESDLFIYCDGPKQGANSKQFKSIQEVREIVRQKKWCKNVTIIESEYNKGLADSIVRGVTEIVSRYGSIIVLEDDIVTSKGFLRYMNEALALYENEEKVMHISAFLPKTSQFIPLHETFFLRFMSCWGWATWKDRWNKANWNSADLLDKVKKAPDFERFNLNGVLDFDNQLERNMEGTLKTWAIKWYSTIFLAKGLCLYPNKTLCLNIGLDGTGENCNAQEVSLKLDIAREIKVVKTKIRESKIAFNYLRRYYRYGINSGIENILKFHYRMWRYQFIKFIQH